MISCTEVLLACSSSGRVFHIFLLLFNRVSREFVLNQTHLSENYHPLTLSIIILDVANIKPSKLGLPSYSNATIRVLSACYSSPSYWDRQPTCYNHGWSGRPGAALDMLLSHAHERVPVRARGPLLSYSLTLGEQL